MFQANRDNAKLKKKVGKLKEKASNPMKVVFEERDQVSASKKSKKTIKE